MYRCAFASSREIFSFVVSICIAFLGCEAFAADVSVDSVLKDLHHPCGVVVRPGGTADRYEVFIADSGAGRIVRRSNLVPKQATDVVTGFKTQVAADPFHQTGPLALLFLDPGLLVVGTTRGQRRRSGAGVRIAGWRKGSCGGSDERIEFGKRRIGGRNLLCDDTSESERMGAGHARAGSPAGRRQSTIDEGPRASGNGRRTEAVWAAGGLRAAARGDDQQLGPDCRGRRRAAD